MRPNQIPKIWHICSLNNNKPCLPSTHTIKKNVSLGINSKFKIIIRTTGDMLLFRSSRSFSSLYISTNRFHSVKYKTTNPSIKVLSDKFFTVVLCVFTSCVLIKQHHTNSVRDKQEMTVLNFFS